MWQGLLSPLLSCWGLEGNEAVGLSLFSSVIIDSLRSTSTLTIVDDGEQKMFSHFCYAVYIDASNYMLIPVSNFPWIGAVQGKNHLVPYYNSKSLQGTQHNMLQGFTKPPILIFTTYCSSLICHSIHPSPPSIIVLATRYVNAEVVSAFLTPSIANTVVLEGAGTLTNTFCVQVSFSGTLQSPPLEVVITSSGITAQGELPL